MPAPQGATHVYNTYIFPFIAEYESEIEDFISTAHERAKSAGLQYIKQAVEWVKVNLLGHESRPPTPPTTTYQSYAQQLLSRFYSTSSTGSSDAAPASNDIYSSIFSAIQAATSGRPGILNRSAAADDLSASGNLIPSTLSTAEDRLSYIRQAREGLGALLQAYEREETDIAAGKPSDTLSKSRSELDFDKIERSEASPDKTKPGAKRTQSGSWVPWAWGAKGEDEAGKAKKDDGPEHEDTTQEAKSTSISLDG